MNLVQVKRNLIRILFSDPIPAEFIMSVFAIAQGSATLVVPQDRILATIVICVGSIRLIALLLGQLWLRLAIAYVAVFSWVYFIMFVFLQIPSPHLPGGIAAAAANMWVAWRLQSESHVRQNIIRDVGQ